jgi:hypothetical protein
MSYLARLGYFLAGLGTVNLAAYKPLKTYLERSQNELEQAMESAKAHQA